MAESNKKPATSADVPNKTTTNEPEEPSKAGKSSNQKGAFSKSSPQHQDAQDSPRRPYSLLTTHRLNRYGMDPKRNLFPKTERYRYYPVTCEYCGKRMQPNHLKDHHQKYHFRNMVPDEEPRTSRAKADEKGRASKSNKRTKSGGGVNRPVCYICGQIFGSLSIGIHEPKCLEKWRIQNEMLPVNMRGPEPVKPEPVHDVDVKGGKDGEYSIPGFDSYAEAAYKSHLRTLRPCSYCSRTFSPDRVLTHQACCIERPRQR